MIVNQVNGERQLGVLKANRENLRLGEDQKKNLRKTTLCNGLV